LGTPYPFHFDAIRLVSLPQGYDPESDPLPPMRRPIPAENED
jgi:hypothetical protein